MLTTIKNQGDELTELHKEIGKLEAKLAKAKPSATKAKATAKAKE